MGGWEYKGGQMDRQRNEWIVAGCTIDGLWIDGWMDGLYTLFFNELITQLNTDNQDKFTRGIGLE